MSRAARINPDEFELLKHNTWTGLDTQINHRQRKNFS
jgi:hypothetical protein